MSLDLGYLIQKFIDQAEKDGDFELYNEAGLQHELAIFLRENFKNSEYRLQLERNIGALDLSINSKYFLKKEMDIYIYNKNSNEKYCIELKFPNKGAFPRRMYQTFEDIKFIEQLKLQGHFEIVAMLFITELENFRKANKQDGIYKYFRQIHQISELNENEIPLFIRKEGNFQPLKIEGKYPFQWHTFKGIYHYFTITF